MEPTGFSIWLFTGDPFHRDAVRSPPPEVNGTALLKAKRAVPANKAESRPWHHTESPLAQGTALKVGTGGWIARVALSRP